MNLRQLNSLHKKLEAKEHNLKYEIYYHKIWEPVHYRDKNNGSNKKMSREELKKAFAEYAEESIKLHKEKLDLELERNLYILKKGDN